MGIFIRLYSKSVRPRIAFKYINQQRTNNEYSKQNTNFKNPNKLNVDYNDKMSADLYDTHVLNVGQQSKFADKRKDVRTSYSETNQEVIYGIYPVLLALQAQRRTFHNFFYKKDVLAKNEKVQEIYRFCQLHNVPSHCVSKGKLNSLAGEEGIHQGICLEASPLSFVKLEDLNSEDKINEKSELKVKYKLWVYLHEINDPMNLGAVLRSAYYLGVDKLFTSKTNCCPITRVVSKASSGVAEIFPVYQVDNVERFLKFLKEYDWQIVASSTSSKDSIPVDKFHSTENILLIIGNEGRGISRELEHLSDALVTIPPQPNCIESIQCLNVSVATSILMYSFLAMLKRNKL